MDRFTTSLCVREMFTLEKRVFNIKMKSFHRTETVRQFSCRCVQWRRLNHSYLIGTHVRAVCHVLDTCRCVFTTL